MYYYSKVQFRDRRILIKELAARKKTIQNSFAQVGKSKLLNELPRSKLRGIAGLIAFTLDEASFEVFTHVRLK